MSGTDRKKAIFVSIAGAGCFLLASCPDPAVGKLEKRVAALEESVNKLEDCCDSGPGRGPIIILEPTSGGGSTLTTVWKLDGTATTSWGNTGELREDAFGSIELFGVSTSSGERVAKSFKVTLTDSAGYPHTIEVERSSTDQFSWQLDSVALVACDFASGNGVPNCKTGSSGLPPEFAGTINSASAVVVNADGSPGTLSSGITQLRVQARQ